MNEGINWILWKSFAQIPIIKPNRLKVRLIKINKQNIWNGYLIFKSTKNVDVIRIIEPTIIDFKVAAVTYPAVISNGEIGADKTS